ncbi:MAG: type II toxin-antitoxin system RelE/ParE family toxin [Nitrospirota bacterium]|jgi:plasmid stabilization system protein ParE
MAGYSLSSKAAADLDGIYEYTILHFGLEQARVYLFGLHERFQMLAEQPTQGPRPMNSRRDCGGLSISPTWSFTSRRTTVFGSCVSYTNAWT